MVPAYDEVTKAMSRWTQSWRTRFGTTLRGQEVDRKSVLDFLRLTHKSGRIMVFLGHGFNEGLCMQDEPDSKRPIALGGVKHGCLVESLDLGQGCARVHVFAWACHAAEVFGALLAQRPGSTFLGFRGGLQMIFDDPASDELWSGIVEQSSQRSINNKRLRKKDEIWLRERLMEERSRLKSGERDTGPFNRFNSMFLKRAARNATFHGERAG